MLCFFQDDVLILDFVNCSIDFAFSFLNAVMPGRNERAVQNEIIEFIIELWRYAVSVQSWSILKKSGRITYKVTLAPQWTPDIFACIDWKFFWIEVKKDESERKARCWIAERYTQEAKEPKSNARQIAQFKTWMKIADSFWLFLCTYSVAHLIELFRDLEKQWMQILSKEHELHTRKEALEGEVITPEIQKYLAFISSALWW